jgi:predicted dehydrogenase
MGPSPAIEALGRPLRLAVIGGGPGSFIGETHRVAARMDGRYQLVAGAVSSDPDRSIEAGRKLGLDPERSYGDGLELIATEADRADGAEVVAIMTPNDTHHLFAMAALENGLDVICDKPITNTLEEAREVVSRVADSGLVFCLTHNYTGYPMVRQASAMVDGGELGEIRLVQVEYVQGGKASENDPDPADGLPWRYDPVKGGPSLVMGDIGSHAHNLVRFITGLEVASVSAEVGTIVPDRLVHDYAAAMLRFDNGARGSLWVTQAAAGVENCLRIRVSGTRGSLEWQQERPTALAFKPLEGPAEMRTPNGPGTYAASRRATRLVAGHPEGFIGAFANIYSDAAEAIAARRTGVAADPSALYFPDAIDGAWGVRFVDAAIESSVAGGAWTDAILEL